LVPTSTTLLLRFRDVEGGGGANRRLDATEGAFIAISGHRETRPNDRPKVAAQGSAPPEGQRDDRHA
jgi:hypothetical protein